MKENLLVITYNVNFGVDDEHVERRLFNLLEKADVLCLQETKNVNLHKMFKGHRDIGVIQFLDSQAVAGSAIVWKRSSGLTLKARGRRLGTRNLGRAMLDRWLVWGSFVFDTEETTAPIIIVSMHYPPQRFWAVLYGNMIRSMLALISSRKRPILVAADWNKSVKKDSWLRSIAKKNRGRMFGFEIDGFLAILKNRWAVEGVNRFPANGPHGHHPIRIKLRPKKR